MMLDAAGNIPAKQTRHELSWQNSINSGELSKRFQTMKLRQSLPLEQKVEMSLERIKEWYEAWDGSISVSYSGGKDSSVLLYLVRSLFPDVKGVFCNTGLEYPEIISLVKQTPNVEVIRPKIPFHHVIRDYGWPVISKKVARGINILRNPTGHNQNIWRLYDQGINRFGKPVNGFKVPKRWRFLINAPFKISDHCCAVMKKEPMAKYEKKNQTAQMLGMMASDSKAREKIYLQTGCNAFDTKHPRSMPLGFWTEQDIIKAIKQFNIPYAKVYGDIIEKGNGELAFNGVKSTGCIFCCFGLHMEDEPNRFQLLRDTHPHLFDFCMNKLGMKDILDYMRSNCPDQKVADKFSYDKHYQQLNLFNQPGKKPGNIFDHV